MITAVFEAESGTFVGTFCADCLARVEAGYGPHALEVYGALPSDGCVACEATAAGCGEWEGV